MLTLGESQVYRLVIRAVGDLHTRMQVKPYFERNQAPRKLGRGFRHRPGETVLTCYPAAIHRDIEPSPIDQSMPHAPSGVLTFEQVLVALLHAPNSQLRRSFRRTHAGEGGQA